LNGVLIITVVGFRPIQLSESSSPILMLLREPNSDSESFSFAFRVYSMCSSPAASLPLPNKLSGVSDRSQSFSTPVVQVFLVIWDFRIAIILLTRKLDSRHTKMQPL
uniref:Secreted protein n=1 Tax=Brugia timori TaxID=42155 RepID=A0A0R3R3A1_9BILA